MASDTFVIAASSDDCMRRRAPSWMGLVEAQMRVGDYSATTYDYEGGMRWTVDIPQGSTINSAYLKIVAISYLTTIPLTIIEGEDADDPITFSNIVDYDGRSRTSQSVNWTPAAWVDGTIYTSPDIKSIIQAIVNRENFGTHIVLFWSHTLGWGGATERLDGASYDHATYDPPKLEVTWTPPPVVAPTVTTQAADGIGFD